VVIRTPDQRLRVFVSSTMGELADERAAVSRAISALRLTPVMFELGARPHPPQEVYRAYLAQSDVFIGLYWQRYGWIGPGLEISGLEDEFELSRGLPRLLYVKVPAPDREPRLGALLSRIAEEASDSYRHFRTAAELGRLVRDDLATLLSERFAAGTPSAADPGPVPSQAVKRGPRPLPAGTTSLVGRDQAIGEVAELVGRPDVRLVTLTGPGGIGKTRLAVAAGERLRERFGAGVVFVPLAAVTDPRLVLAGVGGAVGADMAEAATPLDVLAELLSDGAWLLILDNLEQVVEVAGDFGELLARCPGVTILATSRTVLGLQAEREYPVLPLPVPAVTAAVPVKELAVSPAVALFVDRARAVRPSFALTEGNAAAVVEICQRLEGVPLAIELAAARTRLLDPGTLLHRLASSLDALGTGTVDMPERQHTLRAAVEWSVGLLDQAERSLLEIEAAFVDGWTVEAAAQVAGLDEDQALELTEALARHSLIYLDSTGLGPRPRMLETIRAFIAERLAARADAGEVERRHASYYRTLAQQAERPLRRAGWSEWAERLQAEAGNMAAAVRWYLAHDPEPLPHLFRVLLPLWAVQNETLIQARSWVEQLLPRASSLDPQSQAELLLAATVTAREVGDDAAMLATPQRLAPLLETIQDPYLHTVAQLAVAWTLAIAGELDRALLEAGASLAQFRAQDEPLWTAATLITLGSVETATGRYDDALPHLSEARDLAERLGNDRLTTGSQVQLGILAVMERQPQEARALLDRGLELSLAIHSTRNMTLCLTAFAQLDFDDGDPERAALLAGAAEGLRRRAGLRVWPSAQRGPSELVGQVRQALGADRFDQVFAKGARLNQREAAAAVRD
jgi:predicted ATPase